jgi:hypothetical protein
VSASGAAAGADCPIAPSSGAYVKKPQESLRAGDRIRYYDASTTGLGCDSEIVFVYEERLLLESGVFLDAKTRVQRLSREETLIMPISHYFLDLNCNPRTLRREMPQATA